MQLKHRDVSERRRARRERILKTVGVLPSLATLGNLTCGVAALYMCLLQAQANVSAFSPPVPGASKLIPSFLAAAAYLLLLGMIFDAIDGRLARLARKTTEFGAQLDSMADIVSFGVAPAFLVLCVAQPKLFSPDVQLSVLGRAYWRAEWVMAAIYVCGAALRLARFNVENEEDESAHMSFRGLPTPGAAGAIIGLVLFHQNLLPELIHEKTRTALSALMPPFALVLGLLMVSPFKYAHIVNALLRGRRPFWQVVSLAIVVLIGFVVQFELTLAVVTAAYALSGVTLGAIARISGRPSVEAVLGGDEQVDFSGPDETFDDTDVDDLTSPPSSPNTEASEDQRKNHIRYTGG